MADDSSSSPLDTLQSDGRPLYAHAAMALLNADLPLLRSIVDALPDREESVEDLVTRNGWADNFTLLLMACSSTNKPAHLDIVRYLILDLKANPNDNGCDEGPQACQGPDDPVGSAPLHVAAGCGSLPLVEFLIENGATLWQVDRNGCTPFHWACLRGNLDVVRYFIEKCPTRQVVWPDATKFVNHTDGSGGSGLRWAVQEGHEEIAEYLVSKGADKNQKDKQGNSPIDIARKGGEKLESILAILE